MLFMSVMAAGLSLLVGVVAGIAVGHYEERRRWERVIGRSMVETVEHGSTRDARSSGLDSRNDRLEQAVEAIAIEVERVAEGQRFVTKLLAERGQPLPDRVAQPKQSITPH